MKLDTYQKKSLETAFYPKDNAISYCVLGLCGESGEVADKWKKVIRDNSGILSDPGREDIAKELGDVLWYVSNLAAELGYSLSEVAQMNIDKLSSRQDRGVLGGSGDAR